MRLTMRNAASAVAVMAALALTAPAASSMTRPESEATGQLANYNPGESYLGTDGYVEYLAGNLPVVFAAPHGGSLTPASIPARTSETCGSSDFATVRDLGTEEMARQIQREFYERTGKYPHVVINRLHRNRLDANRALDVAACGNAEAEQAWQEFHAFIDDAKDTIERDHDRGWFTDLHGHGHAVQRLELGYNMTAATLRLSDAELDADSAYEAATSIHTFSQESPLSFSELLRGPTSLGTLFENAGYPATPSQQDPAPEVGEAFFSGGYNTRAHGCGDGGPICGIQIEHHRVGVRDTAESRAEYAAALYDVYDEYLLTNFDILVQSSAQGIDTLLADVTTLIDSDVLTQGRGRALTARLTAAARTLERSPAAAEGQLVAFSRHVEVLTRLGHLGHADADDLTTLAERVVQSIRTD